MNKLNKQLLLKALIFYMYIDSINLIYTVEPSKHNLLLSCTVNKYNDVNLSITKEGLTNFAEQLHHSINIWKQKGYQGVWLHLPLDQSDLVPVAINTGFAYHHATDKKLVMTKWLQDNKKNSLPASRICHIIIIIKWAGILRIIKIIRIRPSGASGKGYLR